MVDDAEKVVKCGGCKLYFMHTEKDTKCPFCHTKYGEKTVEEKPKEKKLTTKPQKESFKMEW